MKKFVNFKSLCALALCFVMLFALCACKDETPKVDASSKTSSDAQPNADSGSTKPKKSPAELIIGKWRGSVDMATLIEDLGMESDEELIVSADIEFTTDGKYNATIDKASFKTALASFADSAFKKSMKEEGLSIEEFETAINMSYDEYLESFIETLVESLPETITSEYKFEGDDIYVREADDDDFEKEEYHFNGEDELVLVEDGTSVTYKRIG